VRMYSDRMEVISPGALPGYITVDNIVEEHFSRNPRIVNGLFQWGYIEELGLGIDRMIEEMVQAGHDPPDFKAMPYSFTVTLTNTRQRAAVPRWARSMNERQARALTYVRENGSITNREYQRICPEVSSETLRLDLVDLVERGLVLKIGSKKGTYYILK
jgi:ATP-dependent DNA helicase RecG